MNGVSTDLEAILNERLATALAALPGGGVHPTPQRTATIKRVVELFLKDVQAVVDEEYRRHSLFQ